MRYQDNDQGSRFNRGMNGARSNGGEERRFDDRFGAQDRYESRGRDEMRGQSSWQSHEGMQQGRGQQSRGSNERIENEEHNDAIVKVIEVVAQSDQGWDDAARRAVEHASKSVRNIRSIYIKDMQGVVRDGRIAQFRLVAKISFVLEGSESRSQERSQGQGYDRGRDDWNRR